MKMPAVNDYSNKTARPLVANYHLEKETIWQRSRSFMDRLQEVCGQSPYLACYSLLFSGLYPVFLSGSSPRNILCYGLAHEREPAGMFQDFLTFLNQDSAFIALPETPSVFSTLLNKSFHAAVIALDKSADLKLVCDAACKVRNGGSLFLYTKKDDIPRGLSDLLRSAKKAAFGGSAVYSIVIDEELSIFAAANNSEAGMVAAAEELLRGLETLKKLTTAIMEIESGRMGEYGQQINLYPRAVEILHHMEGLLLELYSVLENIKLPMLANSLKEAMMDCYIASANRFDTESCFARLRRETEYFYMQMDVEFNL